MTIDVTATLGVPGSASTWAFNVVRELKLLQQPSKDVESFYCDAVERVWPVLRDHWQMERTVVWKLHEPTEAWRGFLAENKVTLVLSVRDPRDAMLSLMERFGETKAHVFDRIGLAFKAVADSLAHDHLILRYEDRFFENPQSVDAVARHIGVVAAGAERARIFEAYRTGSVARFAAELDALPGNRVRQLDATHYDEVTQIHRSHIGDQRVGKWRQQFDRHDRASLTRQLRPFLEAFGYETD